MEKRIRTFKEYKDEYLKSKHNPESFWEEKAHNFEWKKKWKNVLSWDFEKPEVKWFEEGKLNITEMISNLEEERANVPSSGPKKGTRGSHGTT